MQTHTKTIIVTEEYLDQLNHVNNVHYVQWVQDIAEEHWLNNTSTSIRETFFWVLLEHHITYRGEAVLGDTLKVKTYVSKSEGVSSIRHVEFTNTSNNKLIVTSETKWCFMNIKTKRPTRIPEEVTSLFT